MNLLHSRNHLLLNARQIVANGVALGVINYPPGVVIDEHGRAKASGSNKPAITLHAPTDSDCIEAARMRSTYSIHGIASKLSIPPGSVHAAVKKGLSLLALAPLKDAA